MSGYLHYSAQQPALSRVAAALSEAGDAFHNTNQWQDPERYFDGKSACEVVQAAFDEADAKLVDLQQAAERVVAMFDKRGGDIPNGVELLRAACAKARGGAA